MTFLSDAQPYKTISGRRPYSGMRSGDDSMTMAYLGLGANLGQAKQTLKDAVVCLAQQVGITIAQKSCLYKTAPLDADGDDYLNAILAIETSLSPHALLALCQQLETHFGRERPYPNAPRTLDIDILLYGDMQISDADLTIPHPRMTGRAFVLVPLVEMAPELEIPGQGRAAQFLAAVADQRIEKIPNCNCPNASANLA